MLLLVWDCLLGGMGGWRGAGLSLAGIMCQTGRPTHTYSLCYLPLPRPSPLDSTPLGNDSKHLTPMTLGSWSPPWDLDLYSGWFSSTNFSQSWLLPFFIAHCRSSRLWGQHYPY